MSNIDVTVPVYGNPTTQSVRGNFVTAKAEIEALQTDSATKAELAAGYLALAGGAMAGPLLLAADPTLALHPATMQWVNGRTSLFLPLAGGTMQGPLLLAADPVNPLHPATKQYVDTKALPLTGGTMTGPIVLAADPSAALHPTTKQYVDSKISTTAGGYLPLIGGTLLGALVLAGEPTATLHPATKNYVDTKALPLTGGTLTGPLTLAADPTQPKHAATMQWVNAQIGSVAGIPEAPADGKLYGRGSGAWSAALPLAGGAMTGPLSLAADPTTNFHATTMQWVLAQTVKNLPLTGGTLSGTLTVGVDGAAPSSDVRINAAPGSSRYLSYSTAGVLRWRAYVTSTAEAGGNAGTDYGIARYGDTGTFLGNALVITRSTGTVTFNAPGLIISDPANASTANLLTLSNTGASGAGILFIGNGATTPNKYLQAFSGILRVVNSAYNAAILTLTDAGALTTQAGITATTGNITASGGNVSASNNVSATNAVIADHTTAFRTGVGSGGSVLSWETTSGKSAGFRVNGTSGQIEFGPADPSSGSLSSVAATLGTTGNFSATGNITAGGTVTGPGGLMLNSDFTLTASGNARILKWSSGYTDKLDTGTGLRNWTSWDGSQLMGLAVDGTLTVLTRVNAPRFGGGTGGGGSLATIAGGHFVNFDWGSNSQLAYRVDDTTAKYICTAANAANLNLAAGGGGPVGVVLNLNDFASGFFGIYCDASSDERIKRNIAPTAVDALAALQGVEVAQFDVDAAAIAAIQPVSAEEKAALRQAGDAHVPIGLVAQQVQRFIPELVNVLQQPEGHDPALPDDMHNLVLQNAVPYLIRAVQQLAARMTALDGGKA